MQAAASSSQRSIHICTNKTCRRQGSPQVRQSCKWLLYNITAAAMLMLVPSAWSLSHSGTSLVLHDESVLWLLHGDERRSVAGHMHSLVLQQTIGRQEVEHQILLLAHSMSVAGINQCRF